MTPLLHGNQVLTEMWKYELNSFIFKVDIRKGILDQRELFVLGLYSNNMLMIWLILKQYHDLILHFKISFQKGFQI